MPGEATHPRRDSPVRMVLMVSELILILLALGTVLKLLHLRVLGETYVELGEDAPHFRWYISTIKASDGTLVEIRAGGRGCRPARYSP